MPVSASYQVHGIQEALAEINKVDRTLRRQITKDIQRGAGTRLVTAARSFIPTATPLSRMTNGNMIKGRDGTGCHAPVSWLAFARWLANVVAVPAL